MRFGGFQGHQEDAEQMLPPEYHPLPALHLLSMGCMAKISGGEGLFGENPRDGFAARVKKGVTCSPSFPPPLALPSSAHVLG